MEKIMEEIGEVLDNNKEFENSIYEQLAENTIPTEEILIENDSNGELGQTKPSKRKRNENYSSGDVFSCEECDYTAIARRGIDRHVQAKHEGVCYTCDQCGYKATRKDILRTHVKTKHEDYQYHCQECEYKVGSRQGLDYHIQSKHEGVRYSLL